MTQTLDHIGTWIAGHPFPSLCYALLAFILIKLTIFLVAFAQDFLAKRNTPPAS
jgi:hypothetical protein